MAEIQKGKISTLEGGMARVIPATASAVVTRPLVIQSWLRGPTCSLAVGMEVLFCTFEDGTGSVIARADGSWVPHFDCDVKANAISLEGHTHTCPDGETGGPH